jgi:hypothetical protein
MLKVWKKKRQMFLDKGSLVWYNIDTRIGNYAFSSFVLFGDVEKANPCFGDLPEYLTGGNAECSLS